MEIWASIQNDPVMQHLRDTLSTKNFFFDEIRIVSPTLVVQQRLSHLQDDYTLKGEIAELHRK